MDAIEYYIQNSLWTTLVTNLFTCILLLLYTVLKIVSFSGGQHYGG